MSASHTKRAAPAISGHGSQESVRLGGANASRDTKQGLAAQHLEDALFYARAGLPITPLNPRTGEPLKNRLGTANLQCVREWWRQHKNALVGVPTGRRSGVVAFDFLGTEHRVRLAELGLNCLPGAVFPLETGRERLFAFATNACAFPTCETSDGIRVYGEDSVVVLPPAAWIEFEGGAHGGTTH